MVWVGRDFFCLSSPSKHKNFLRFNSLNFLREFICSLKTNINELKIHLYEFMTFEVTVHNPSEKGSL